MKERIDRTEDANLYQPKIHSDRIRELYAMKLITGLPITVLVDLAIQDFLNKGLKDENGNYRQSGSQTD